MSSRHFKLVAADGTTTYASISGDQPEPLPPPGGTREEWSAGANTSLPPTLSLAMQRIGAKSQIDAAAERVRAMVMTQGAGMALVYERKRAEAADYLAGGAGPWPMLEAEVGITQPTLQGMAVLVATLSDAWVQLAAAIETVRLSAKQAVDAAETGPAIEQLLATIHWPGATS